MDFDRTLINRLSQGDHAAFNAIFTQAYLKVYSFALGFLKNTFDAEDVAQTVFTNLWVKRQTLDRIINLDSYLFIMTRNAIMNQIISYHNYHLDLSDIDDVASTDCSIEKDFEAKELQLYIELLVEKMPPQRQQVYRLSREQGKTIAEIAEIMQLKKKTVENHLNLALKEIRKLIKIFILLLGSWV
ncbi:MAG: RNA polymerase sigma-70 factor [Bacteroides sp.]